MQPEKTVDDLVVSLHAAGEGARFIGNGFLVSLRHVLTAESNFAGNPEGHVILVRFPGQPDAKPQSATLKERIPEARAVLLELSAGAPLDIVPPLDERPFNSGVPWKCVFVAPPFPGLIHGRGTTLEAGTEQATVLVSPSPQLDGDFTGSPPPLWPSPVGAPIAFENRIAGMIVPPVDPAQQSPPWTAVPSHRLLATPAAAVWTAALAARGEGGLGTQQQKAAPPTESAPPATSPSLDLDRFTVRGRRAICHAEGLRERRGQPAIHMEHLLAGLAEDPEGIPRRLLRKAGIDDGTLRQMVKKAVGVDLPDDYAPQEPPANRALSGHTRRALEGAQFSAERRLRSKNPTLDAVDLFIGALQVENCGLIGLLRVSPDLTPEAVLAYTVPPSVRAARDLEHYVLPGVGSDQPKGIDQLDITAEVEALASVVAASDTEPPIAIGLFGEWGSGKSFFMGKMSEQVKKLAREGRERGDSSFCSEIVQIPFNAWHYADTNLWASLLTELFEGLAAHLDGKEGKDETDAMKRARLLTRVASSKDVIVEAQKEKAAAETALQEASARIQRLEDEQKRVDKTLSTGLLREVMRELIYRETPSGAVPAETELEAEERQKTIQAEKDIREQVDSAVQTLGIAAGRATPDLKAALLEAKGAAALWKTLREGMSPRVAIALALLVAAIATVLYFRGSLVGWLADVGSALPKLAAAAAPLVVALTWVARTLQPWLKKAREAMALLSAARTRHRQTIEAETEKKREALVKEKEQIGKRAAEAHAQVQQATDDLRKLEDEIDRLRADRRMSEFIRERSTSTDYTRYLGIMARAQHDFERLSDLLKDVRYETDRKDLPSIDRIVLYIDDLDRCPENKVFDVLQAVHLLLAYPLFVVVVGVDPRWLLHSLRARARALDAAQDGDAGATAKVEPDTAKEASDTEWVANPMEYLEKIFQIPFTLRPMEVTGYGNLIDSLTHARSAQPPGHAKTPAAPPPPAPPPAPPPGNGPEAAKEAGPAAPGAPPAGSPPPPPPPAGGAPPPQNVAAATATPSPAARKVERLQLTDPERDFMKRLHEFIPSPRATKRFVNVYRLIRASADELFDDLVGNANWGDHRAVLLLLAVLTGHPEQATEMLKALVERDHQETWWQFVEGYGRRDGEEWKTLLRRLDLVKRRGDIPLHKSCWYFQRWARQVARYSFQSGRVLIAERTHDGSVAPATIPASPGGDHGHGTAKPAAPAN